ncbi:hypothetical protein CEXT_12771 [Caerostris extrusa]|uniref:Uncharacterized protein n=1 Tax=Caerostris extrusa TaxID=172846 RepID=A0AAV4Y7P9_CAEEX|nr:hypothetical protein CEXT_12771 [Caerostris extrusa]
MKFARESEGFEVSHERLPPPTLEERQNILFRNSMGKQQKILNKMYFNILIKTTIHMKQVLALQIQLAITHLLTYILEYIRLLKECLTMALSKMYFNINIDRTFHMKLLTNLETPTLNLSEITHLLTYCLEIIPLLMRHLNISLNKMHFNNTINPTFHMKLVFNMEAQLKYPFTNAVPVKYSLTQEAPKYGSQQNVLQHHYQPNISYERGLYPEIPVRNYPISDTFPGKYSVTDESPKYGTQQNEFQHQYQTSIPHETAFTLIIQLEVIGQLINFLIKMPLQKKHLNIASFQSKFQIKMYINCLKKVHFSMNHLGVTSLMKIPLKMIFLNKSSKREYFTDKSFKEQPVLYKVPNIAPIPDQSSKIGQISKESPKNSYFIDKSIKRGAFVNEPFEKGFITGKINEGDNLLPSKDAEDSKQNSVLKKSPVSFNEGHITNEDSKDIHFADKTEGIQVNKNSYENKLQGTNLDIELHNSTHFASNESMANQNDTKTPNARDVEFKRTNSESEIKNAASEVESRRNNVKLDLENADFKADENKIRLSNYFGSFDSKR